MDIWTKQSLIPIRSLFHGAAGAVTLTATLFLYWPVVFAIRRTRSS